MELTVNPDQHTLDGRMVLRYRNVPSTPLSSVRLRLDQNLSSGMSMELVTVEDAGGKALTWTLKPLKFGALSSDSGMVDVVLTHPIAPAADATFTIRFCSTGKHVALSVSWLRRSCSCSFRCRRARRQTPAGPRTS